MREKDQRFGELCLCHLQSPHLLSAAHPVLPPQHSTHTGSPLEGTFPCARHAVLAQQTGATSARPKDTHSRGRGGRARRWSASRTALGAKMKKMVSAACVACKISMKSVKVLTVMSCLSRKFITMDPSIVRGGGKRHTFFFLI